MLAITLSLYIFIYYICSVAFSKQASKQTK